MVKICCACNLLCPNNVLIKFILISISRRSYDPVWRHEVVIKQNRISFVFFILSTKKQNIFRCVFLSTVAVMIVLWIDQIDENHFFKSHEVDQKYGGWSLRRKSQIISTFGSDRWRSNPLSLYLLDFFKIEDFVQMLRVSSF